MNLKLTITEKKNLKPVMIRMHQKSELIDVNIPVTLI